MATSEMTAKRTDMDGRAAMDGVRPSSEGVKSAVRVLAVIGLLTTERNGATFGDICGRLELPKSSTHALLRTMTDQGYVTIDPSTRRYHIGIRLWEAGGLAGSKTAGMAEGDLIHWSTTRAAKFSRRGSKRQAQRTTRTTRGAFHEIFED